jgi:hypothetical protein
LAGLATGSLNTAGTAAANADYLPRNAEGGRIGVTSEPVAPNANFPGGFFICSVMQGRFARQLDATIDDGNTTSGSLRVIGQNAPNDVVSTVDATGAGIFAATLTPANDSTTYTVCMGN